MDINKPIKFRIVQAKNRQTGETIDKWLGMLVEFPISNIVIGQPLWTTCPNYDGAYWHTSKVVECLIPPSQDQIIVNTKNSIYYFVRLEETNNG